MRVSFVRNYLNMALITRAGFSTNTEVEASSFSVWNCVITVIIGQKSAKNISSNFVGVHHVNGVGWNQGQIYNVTPDNLGRFQHYRAIAFFFAVWALQSVALALLLVWAIGKRSYHLCHSWILCEALMQVFIVLSAVYFTYRSINYENETYLKSSSLLDSNEEYQIFNSTTSTLHRSRSQKTFQPPKHLAFLIILHFLIKGFGFWIVRRYMKLLKSTNIHVISNSEASPGNGSSVDGATSGTREISPPPSHSYLCKDDLPCYDEAVRLCLKEPSSETVSNQGHVESSPSPKHILVPV